MKMKKLLLLTCLIGTTAFAQTDSINSLPNVVITGTRNAVDVRHLPNTVTVIDRQTLTQSEQVNILPTLSQQVPGLFVTSRGMMGYGVSGGAAGGIVGGILGMRAYVVGYSTILALPIFEDTILAAAVGVAVAIAVAALVTFILGFDQNEAKA